MDKVYLETSIVSYLTARPSRDVVTLARQELTREWWATRRHRFDLYTADIVVGEASEGRGEAAGCRLTLLEEIPELGTTPEAENLADSLLREGLLPEKAAVDALHIAIATAHQVDYGYDVRKFAAYLREQAAKRRAMEAGASQSLAHLRALHNSTLQVTSLPPVLHSPILRLPGFLFAFLSKCPSTSGSTVRF